MDYGNFKVNLIRCIANYKEGVIKILDYKNHNLVDKEDLSDLDWEEADLPILKDLLKFHF